MSGSMVLLFAEKEYVCADNVMPSLIAWSADGFSQVVTAIMNLLAEVNNFALVRG